MAVSAMILLVLEHLQEIIRAQSGRVHFVGGCVRDLLQGRPLHDLDLVVDGNAIGLARKVANSLHGAFVLLDEEHDIARAVLRGRKPGAGITLDFAGLRGNDLKEDLAARDFTINAMAMSPSVFLAHARQETDGLELVDPWKGQADLQDGVIRAVQERAFRDDPLRALRAVRLAAQLEFEIEAQTATWARQAAGLLVSVSWERIRDELARTLACAHSAPYLPLLEELGLLLPTLSELKQAHATGQLSQLWEAIACLEWIQAQQGQVPPKHDTPLWRPAALLRHPDLSADLPHAGLLSSYLDEHVCAERTRTVLIKLALLLYKGAGPAQGQDRIAHGVSKRLRLSTKESAHLGIVVRQLSRAGHILEAVSHRQVYRLYRDSGEMATGVLLAGLADFLATAGPHLQLEAWQRRLTGLGKILEMRYEHKDKVIDPPRLLDGNELMQELGLNPGPLIGELLESIREAQAVGEVHTAEQALAWARRSLEERRE